MSNITEFNRLYRASLVHLEKLLRDDDKNVQLAAVGLFVELLKARKNGN